MNYERLRIFKSSKLTPRRDVSHNPGTAYVNHQVSICLHWKPAEYNKPHRVQGRSTGQNDPKSHPDLAVLCCGTSARLLKGL